jgi:hypothetical protein
MRIEDVEAALRRMPLPGAPRSLREQVARGAADALARPAAPIPLRAPRPRVERLSLAGALLAAAAVLGAVLLPPSRPPRRRRSGWTSSWPASAIPRPPAAPARSRR